MIRTKAAGSRILALAFLAGTACVGLAGCGSIDQALFGGGSEEAAQPAANGPAAAAAPEAAAAAPETTTAGTPAPGPAPVTTAEMGAEFAPVTVEAGTDTGTTVGHAIAGLRTQLQTLETKLATDAQRFADLRASSAQAITTYQEATAHIATRLQIGTTRGNPELIAEWNNAQRALDTLTGNINALAALGTELSSDSSTAHYELDTIQATTGLSGAVDEDHRQLGVLTDETNQTNVIVDRLLGDASETMQRQTAYVANERANLTTLANAIKAGEYYGPSLSAPPMMQAAAPMAGAPSGAAIVSIKFDRKRVSYDRVLYAALSRALGAHPSASFMVAGISPARGTVAAIQIAQSDAERHAQEVMRSMSEMGVPMTRMSVSSSTDPNISAVEVRVYLR